MPPSKINVLEAVNRKVKEAFHSSEPVVLMIEPSPMLNAGDAAGALNGA